MKIKTTVFSVTVLTLLLFSSTPVGAVSLPSGRPAIDPIRTERPFGTPRGDTTNRCNAAISAIRGRSENLNRGIMSMLANLDAALSGVQSYYTRVILPSGVTVTDYNRLVSEAQTKRAAVVSALAVANADLAALNCNSLQNARTNASNYNRDVIFVRDALTSYRSAVQSLILAVHGVRPRTGLPTESRRPATLRPSLRPIYTPRRTFVPERSPGIPPPRFPVMDSSER